MRKLVFLCLVFLMSLGLSACGSNDKKDPSQQAGTTQGGNASSATKKDDATAAGTTQAAKDDSPVYWVTDSSVSSDFNFPALEVNEYTVKGSNEKVKIFKTDLFRNFDEVADEVWENEFLNKTYVLARETVERGRKAELYSDVGLQTKYEREDAIRGVIRENVYEGNIWFHDFDLVFDRNVYESDSVQRVYTCFEFGEMTPETDYRAIQEGIITVLESVYGKELAQFLAYAEDRDGKDFDKKAIEPYNLEELYATTDDCQYSVTRDVSTYHGKYSVTFNVRVINNLSNRFNLFSDGYEPIASQFSYLPSKVFEGDLGQEDMAKSDSFADKFCSIGDIPYLRTVLDFYRARTTKTSDGMDIYEFQFDVARGIEGVSKLILPEFTLEYRLVFKGDELFRTGFVAESYADPIDSGDEAMIATYQKMLVQMNGQIEALIGQNLNLTLEDMTAESETKYALTTTVPITLAGKPLEARLRMTLYKNGATELWGGYWKLEKDILNGD